MTATELSRLIAWVRLLDRPALARVVARSPMLPPMFRRLANLSGQLVQHDLTGGICRPDASERQSRLAYLSRLLQLDRLSTVPTGTVLDLIDPPMRRYTP